MNKLILVMYLTVVIFSVEAQLIDDVLSDILNKRIKMAMEDEINPRIIKSDNKNDGSGNYNYNYELSDGTKHEQTGTFRNPDSLNPFVAVKGIYEWISPERKRFRVNYEANENGYRTEIEEWPGPVGLPPKVAATMMG